MRRRGLSVVYDQVLAEQEERDLRDSSRSIAPLRPAHDAIVIDTSDMHIEQVIARLEEDVRRCRG
jgi:cytidylate kinase